MGIDAVISVEVPPTPANVVRVHALCREFATCAGHEKPRVEVSSLCRYFGPGYMRGPWPVIRQALVALREAFPDAVVRYGGDETPWGLDLDVVTDALFVEYDAIWTELCAYRAAHPA